LAIKSTKGLYTSFTNPPSRSTQAAALQLAELAGAHPKHYPQDSHQSLREALHNSKTTKQLVDILAPLQQSDDPQFILVEGLPGIGKSLLLQEITYNWAVKVFTKV